MTTWLHWLSEVCSTLFQPRFELAPAEITMHDALRLCQTVVVPTVARLTPATSANKKNAGQIQVQRYRSETDLKEQWKLLERATDRGQVIVLVLAHWMQQNLTDLIRRQVTGEQLLLVPDPAIWPGSDTPADLMLHSSRLGWSSISVCRELSQVLATTPDTDRLVLFLPGLR